MRKVYKHYCAWCGRLNEEVRPTSYRRDGIELWAPFCQNYLTRKTRTGSVRLCQPYEQSEKYSPHIIHHWCERPYNPEHIDRGILPFVERCRQAGLLTLFSCDGHGQKVGYIVFYDEDELWKAVKLLGEDADNWGSNPHHYLGTIYPVYIKSEVIVNPLSPSERMTRVRALREKLARLQKDTP